MTITRIDGRTGPSSTSAQDTWPLVTQPAPDFDLPSTLVPGSGRHRAALADYRGRWLILLFYPRDFSLICPTEVSAFSARIDELRRRGADVLGISVDTVESHQRWIDLPASEGGLGGLNFPLASDGDGVVSRAYRVFLEKPGVALRGLFLIDPEGRIQYQVVHNQSVGRRMDEVLRVLDALQSGGLCVENWSTSDEMLDPTQVLGPGRVVSHYRIQRRVGQGTFAEVFKAYDMQLERPVALKIIKFGGSRAMEGVLAEARAAAALNHPNVCTIYAVDDSEGVPFIAMEYLRGRPLAKLLEAGPLAPDRAAEFVRQVAAGMAAAHAAGVVHGDLKPGNIMITDQEVAKILDFGLARPRTQEGSPAAQNDPDATLPGSHSSPGGISGTPAYMSPEQVRGETASPASDVFSLGAILFEMLTGRKAFSGKDILSVLRAVEHADSRALARDLPSPFNELAAGCLALSVMERPTMQDIARQLAT